MTSSFPKATAVAMVVTLLATTAEAAAAGSSSIPATIATRDFLFSPISLWVAANAIIIWLLLSSSRRAGNKANDADDATAASSSSTAGHDGEVAMDGLYTSSSEYEAFSDAGSVAFNAPVSRRLPREAKAAARKTDRPRVRKKPAGHQVTASPRSVAAEAREAAGDEEEEDVSMDSLWESIVQRRAARPVVVRKSESWGNEELPRLQRVAETARRGEMRKSVSAVSNKAAAATAATQQQAAAAPSSAAEKVGWRRRDVLVGTTPDDLLRRAESFIRRQHEHLRLQRQESEQRQLQLQRRLEASPALIRV